MIRRLWIVMALLTISGCQEVLVSNLSEAQSQRLCAALGEKGISFDREINSSGQWSVYVEKSDLLRSLLLLKQNQLLTDYGTARTIEPSAFSTTYERKLHLQRKREQEIEQALEKMPGVVQARLLLSPDLEIRTESPKNSLCGSLIVLADSRLTISPKQIRQIVSGATGFSPRCLRTVINRLEEINPPISAPHALPSILENDEVASSGDVLRKALGVVGLISTMAGVVIILRSRSQGRNVS
jgi:type III secretory pathway lipoprotein EscJ